jgi:N-formylglutamate amidohydrolase
MTDKFTDRLASAALAAAGVAATLFVNRASRLLIDPERFLSEDEPMRAVGMGAVYQSTSSKAPLRAPDPQRDQRLIESWFHPYARAFTELIDNTLAEHGRAVIVDLHSFPREPLPYELDQSAMRPSICIGTDPFHTPPPLRQLTFAAFADPAWTIVENTPFAGSYVPLEHYGVTRAVSSVMVELRRDLYQQEPGGPPHAGFAHVVDHLSRFFHALADQAPES